MRFLIKPGSTAFPVVLETASYQRIWKQHGTRLVKTMQQVTGLMFQQTQITARIYPDGVYRAGNAHEAMRLVADQGVDADKLITLVHELGHRLLNANNLSPVHLGLIPDTSSDDEIQETSHRHLYLFEYDVVRLGFGQDMAEICSKFEAHEGNPPYAAAWTWAMGMSYAERQRAMKILAAEAVTRDKWHELDNKKVTPRDLHKWYGLLNTTADPALVSRLATKTR